MTSHERSFRERAKQYAKAVVSGRKLANRFVVLACKRFLADLKRKDIVLDQDAEKWCRFLEKLPHVKGKWAARGELLKLSDWQVFIVVNVYGWKWKRNGRRRFREAYVEVGRKNGKSRLVAGIGLGHLVIDGEFGAEIYTGATSEKQAWEVFKPAREISLRDSEFREYYGVTVNAKSLIVDKTGSKFEPVIGKPGDGSSPSCAIADEFHEHDSIDMVDTFRTGMGAREQPMLWMITTAGYDVSGPCYHKRDDIVKILEGAVEDDGIFGIIYTIDEDDRWDDIAAARKANPNFGISIEEEFIEGQLRQARRSALAQVAYKAKHLNLWVGAKKAWMNMLAYQACRKRIRLEDYSGRRCFVGLDLASKIDVAAMSIVFPPENAGERWAVFCRYFLPEDAITDGGNTKYRGWHTDGWITATPGNIIDFGYIEDELEKLKSVFEITEIAYDPFQATHFAVRMLEEGFPMVELGMTVRNMSQPMKELESFILSKQIIFEHDPVLMWMFGNVVAKVDKKDNVFPDKEKADNKIDGVVATIAAINRALVHMHDAPGYDDKDLLVL